MDSMPYLAVGLTHLFRLEGRPTYIGSYLETPIDKPGSVLSYEDLVVA